MNSLLRQLKDRQKEFFTGWLFKDAIELQGKRGSSVAFSPFLFAWELNQVCLMSFGMKNDLCFFLSIIFYKNRAERARKNIWRTNGYVQSFLKIKQMSGHSGAGGWSGRVPPRGTQDLIARDPITTAPRVFLIMSLAGELIPSTYSWEFLPVLLPFKNHFNLWFF